MENVISEWLRCPVCGNKTRLKIRGDTELKYFPLFCPKCRQETLGNTAEHAKGKALREDSIRQGIVGHSISDAGALI